MDLQLRGAHGRSAPELEGLLTVNFKQGLSTSEAQLRLRQCGANRLTASPQRPLWLQFLAQFHAPLLYALLITGAVKAFSGSLGEAAVIWSVTVINAVIGFVQESRAERSIGALAEVIRCDVEVLRDGQRQRIDPQTLVPGDVVLLTAGDRVPADLRLLHVHNLQLDESSLTGESLPVAKAISADPVDALLAERYGMAHAGSFVTTGQGRGLVVATGDATELGDLAASLQQGAALSTPLTRKFARFSVSVLKFVLGLSILTALVGQTQWAVAAGVVLAPLPSLDLLVLAGANGLMLQEMGRLWGSPWTLEQLQAAAQELAKAALQLGVVEWSSQALAGIIKWHGATWLVGSAVQALSAAYLTRVVARAMADYLALASGVAEADLALLKAQAPLLVARAAETEKLDWSAFLQQGQHWLRQQAALAPAAP